MSSAKRQCPKCLAHAVKQRRRRTGTLLDCQVCGEGTFRPRAAVAVAERPKEPLPAPERFYWTGLN